MKASRAVETTGHRARGVSAAGLALALAAAVAAPAAGQYAQGEIVVISGRAADTGGRPVPGLSVRLEAARSKLSLRRLGRVRGHPTEIATATDGDGEYRLEWEWHDFYDRFDVVLALRTTGPSGAGWTELDRVDISSRITRGSPVIVQLDAGDDPLLERHRTFYARLGSPDEREVFERMGTPDKVSRIDLGAHEEASWWYFRNGTGYRFVDGRLDEAFRFEPVSSF